MLVTLGGTLGIGFYTLRKRNMVGARPFAMVILLEAAWTVSYWIGYASLTLQSKAFWDNVQWVMIVFLPLAILAFAREYADKHFKKPSLTRAGLLIIPILTILLIFTNPLHGWAENSGHLIPGDPFPTYDYHFGVPLWISIFYGFAIAILAIMTLVGHAFRFRGMYRVQTWIIVLGFLIPALGEIVGLTGIIVSPDHSMDLSSYTFPIANLVIAFGLFRFRLFDIIPIARDQVMEKMDDGVMIIDSFGRVLDVNNALKKLLSIHAPIQVGQPLVSILPEHVEQLELHPNTFPGHKIISLHRTADIQFIDVNITPLMNHKGDFSGHMLIFRDVTEHMLYEQGLRRDQDTLERRVARRTSELNDANEALKAEVEQRRRAELQKETQRSDMETLYKLMVELAALPAETDTKAFISTRLMELTNAYFVAVTEYDPVKKQIELRHLESDNKAIQEVNQLIGKQLTELTFPVSDEMYAQMIEGNVGYRRSLSEVAFGSIPPIAGTMVEKLFNLDLFIGMAIQNQGELMGTFILGMQHGQAAPSDWLVMALANALSIIYQRERSDRDRRESESRFQNLANMLPQPIFECNLAGQITYANQIGLEMMGYSRIDTGISIANLFPPEMREKARDAFQNTLAGKEVSPHEYLAQRKDGSTFPVLVYSKPIYQDHQLTGLRGIVVDITEQKQHEHELEVIVTMSRALRSAETSTKLLLMIYNQVIELLHGDFATLELIDRMSGDAEVVYSYGLDYAPKGMRTPYDQGLNHIIRTTKKPYLENHLAENPQALAPLVEKGCNAIAGAPMIAEDELIGFLWIGRKTAISEVEVHLLAAIADIAASSIRRMTLHELTKTQLNHLSSLREIDTAINNSKDLAVTLGVLLEQTQTQLRADASDVLLCTANTTILEHQLGLGFHTPSFSHHTFKINEGPAGMAVQNKQLVQIQNLMDLGADHRLVIASQKEGFVSYFAVPLMTQTEVKGVLEVYFRKEFAPDRDWLNFLETLAGQAAIAIEQVQLFNGLQTSNQELVLAYDETIEGWVKALDLRDKETEGHSLRVTQMCVDLAVRMGFQGEPLIHIRRGALLHDIGKMGIPDHILLKNGPLTAEEWEIMRQHPIFAQRMLSGIDYLKPALEIPMYHHEYWNGSGYPFGLQNCSIPLVARIFSIVDVWDALISDRPYRAAWPADKVRAYIAGQSGIQFDPEVVQTFFQYLDQQAG